MAKGYPGRKRARKAYWRGILSARRRKAFNPYVHPRLRELFERGRAKALETPALVPPPRVNGNRRTSRIVPRDVRDSRDLRDVRSFRDSRERRPGFGF